MTNLERSRLRHLTPFLLSLALGIQLYRSLLVTSVTVDELAHLPAGIVYLEQRSFALYHHNPPLLRMLAAAPLLLFDVETSALPDSENRWSLGMNFLYSNRDAYHELYMTARTAMIGLAILTGLVIFYWTQHMVGYWPATVAMLLFCLSPTVLAHGGLVTTDMGFCLMFLMTFVAWVTQITRVTWPRTVMLGVIVGLAQLTKFTAIILYPYLLAGWLLVPLLAKRKKAKQRQRAGLEGLPAGRRWLHFAVMVAISLVVINAGYLFQGTGSPLNRLALQNPRLKAIAQSPLGSLPAPLPTEYLRGFDAQYQESQGVFQAYFMGVISTEGWLHYYVTALLCKVPLPLWLMLAATLLLMQRGAIQRSPSLVACLAIPAVSVAVFSVLTNINLGVRYLLFILPLLHIAAGHLALAAAGSRKVLIFLVVCLVWYAGSSLLQFPHYISYFSDIVGRSQNGHRLLADSNIDWGQDLIHLREEMEQRGIDSIALAHFGLVDPAVYGIRYEFLTPQARSKYVAVSTNLLLGIDPWGQGRTVGLVREMTPVGRVGHSIFLFERPEAAAGADPLR